MCGIAGVVSSERDNAVYTVGRMLNSMRLRGPDSEGLESWPHAVLGHRRLAIYDLSPAGDQPMLSACRSVGVVFNGAIYNFLDLRKELESAGHQFKSNSDTEVLVEGYLEWGIDELVSRLRGMFAFGLWDQTLHTLYLVRDRLGVKPLVYYASDRRLAFASTVQAIHRAGFAAAVDPHGVLDFLEYGFVTDERSIYEDVKKVPAASILEWRDGRLRSRRYWTPPRPAPVSSMTFDEAVRDTERLLLEAVKLRLTADVPIGALLSGGIDSTLVCWAIAELKANVTAFTISTPGDPGDEAAAARMTARMLGIPHRVVTLSREQDMPFEDLLSAYGEPFACPSALGMLRVSAAVKPMATVLLTGDGGDDVFLGYPFHRHFWMAQNLSRLIPSGGERLWQRIRPAIATFAPLRRPVHFLDYATGGLGAVTRVNDGLPFYRQHFVFGERLRGLDIAPRQIPLSLPAARRLLPDVVNYERQTRLAGEFLTKVDGATMHHGIEARSPFLDHQLWEYASSIPFRHHLRNGTLKAVLREIVRRRVGRSVAARKKQGFSIPVESWLSGRWTQYARELCDRPLLERDGWLQPGSLNTLLLQHSSKPQKHLWDLLILEKWLRRGTASYQAVAGMGRTGR